MKFPEDLQKENDFPSVPKDEIFNFHNRSQNQLVTDCHQLNLKKLIVDFYEADPCNRTS